MLTKVFVYGTLRKGLAWNHLLRDSEFIGKAITKDRYGLYADSIPYLIENEKVSNITGEVYKIDQKTLNILDKLEGHPNWYTRKEINVILDCKDIITWIYFFPKAIGNKILSGNYLDYQDLYSQVIG